MQPPTSPRSTGGSARPDGFTLVELAIVLLVVSILLGGLLMSLSAQVGQERLRQTNRDLDEIRGALIGFAVINGRLPCPDTDFDPAAAGYGVEEANCDANAAAEGLLPWKTLGVPDIDAWGTRRTDPSSPRRGDWRYRIERKYARSDKFAELMLAACPGSGCAAFPDDRLKLVDAAGSSLNTSAERPIAIVYSAGANGIPDGQNVSYEVPPGAGEAIYQAGEASSGFDDMAIWLSRPILANRLIAAGRLP